MKNLILLAMFILTQAYDVDKCLIYNRYVVECYNLTDSYSCFNNNWCESKTCIDNICNDKIYSNINCTLSISCPNKYYCNTTVNKCRAKQTPYTKCRIDKQCISEWCVMNMFCY